MPVLHTINTFADQSTPLEDCIRLLGPGDAVVFVDEAARAVSGSEPPFYRELLASHCDFYVLAETDTQVSLPQGFKRIDYDDFVDLCCQYSPIQNWY